MKKITYVLRVVIDILFPQKKSILRIERMSIEEVESGATRADLVKNHEKNFHALFKYHDPLAKSMVWEIKYRGNPKILDMAGCLLSKKIREELFEYEREHEVRETPEAHEVPEMRRHREATIIIPIPISEKRLKERGFSQTKLLAEAVIKNLAEGLAESLSEVNPNFSYLPDILVKIKNTPSQTSLGNRHERLSNLSGAFALKDGAAAEAIRGKNIILIDDVITTGATLEEACGVLMDAGARSVRGFAIAH